MDEQTEIGTSKYHNVILECVDCGHEFVFTAGEQRFYHSKGLSRPKRCEPCRKERKGSIAREERW